MSNVNGIDSQKVYSNSYNPANAKAQNSQGNQDDQGAIITDQVDIGNNTQDTGKNKIYTRDSATIAMLKQTAENNMNTLRTMVQKLLSNQGQVGNGLKSSQASFNFNFDMSFLLQNDTSSSQFSFSFNFDYQSSMTSDGMVEIDQATRDQAASLIGEDGPMGVKQVSENILGFAKALSGGDPSKIETLKNAFLKGFSEVANLFGGKDKMPEVSQKTYDAVMAGFEQWAKGDAAAE